MHVDVPYGMIDFAQESGRAGRAGEDVDSVIVVAEGRVDRMRGEMRGADDSTIYRTTLFLLTFKRDRLQAIKDMR